MESYYLIIEGLVSMMESVGSLPLPAEAPPPPPAEAASAPAPHRARARTRARDPAHQGVGAKATTATAGGAGAGRRRRAQGRVHDMVDVRDDRGARCERRRATRRVGAVLCTYTFNTSDAASAVGFSIGVVGGGAPLVTLRQASGEGSFTVEKAGLLHATLDNSQAMFMPLTVAARCRSSCSRSCKGSRSTRCASRCAELAENEQKQRHAAEREAQIVAEEKALVAKLAQLQAQVAQCQQALARKGSELVQSERYKMELAGEQASLKIQLRKTLWKMPRNWLDALPKS